MTTEKLSVGLPSGTLYVSGTVNGVATTWTNVEGNTWESVADKADDGMYLVELTIINQLGQSSETSFTLYYGLNLITDRTQADIDRLLYLRSLFFYDPETGKTYFLGTEEELAEWNAGLRGAYTAADLNRVGAAVEYVVARLTEAGYVITVSTKLDWLDSDNPTAEQMETYLNNIREIRGSFPGFPDTPDVPADMDGLDYNEANNIEKILMDVDQLITHMVSSYVYSNEVNAGEV